MSFDRLRRCGNAVTLLALGNGAPDLVSSMAFVRKGQYRIAISGLLGKLCSTRPSISLHHELQKRYACFCLIYLLRSLEMHDFMFSVANPHHVQASIGHVSGGVFVFTVQTFSKADPEEQVGMVYAAAKVACE